MSEHDFQNKMDGKLDNYHHEHVWNIETTLKSQPDTLSYIKKKYLPIKYLSQQLLFVKHVWQLSTIFYVLQPGDVLNLDVAVELANLIGAKRKNPPNLLNTCICQFTQEIRIAGRVSLENVNRYSF